MHLASRLQLGGPFLWREDDITLRFPARHSRSSFADYIIALAFIAPSPSVVYSFPVLRGARFYSVC